MSPESEAAGTWSSMPSSSDRESQLDPGSRSPSAGGNNTATMSSSPAEDLVNEQKAVDLLHRWTRSEAEANPEKTRQVGFRRAQTDVPSSDTDTSNRQRSEPPIRTGGPARQSGALAPLTLRYTPASDLVRQVSTTTNNAHSSRAPTAEEIFPNLFMMKETRAYYGDKPPPFTITNKVYKAGCHYHAGGPDEPGGLGYRFVDMDMKNLRYLFGDLVTSPINKIFWTPWNEHFNFFVMQLGGISVIIRSRGRKQTTWMGPHKQFDELCVGRGFRNRGNSTLFKHQSLGRSAQRSPKGPYIRDTKIQIQHKPNAPTSSLNAASKRRRTFVEDDTEEEEEEEEDEDEDEDGLYSPDHPRRTKRVARPSQSSTHPNESTPNSGNRRNSANRRSSMLNRLTSEAERKANKVLETPMNRGSAQIAHSPISLPRPQVPATNDVTAGVSNQKLSKTRLHISLNTNNYGSVPVYLKSCPTIESFFDTCFDAWDLHDKATQIGAITATLSWLPKNDQTMVLMRKIPDSYQYLLDAIEKAPCWEEGGESATCDVRVKVIMESRAGDTKE